MVSQTSQYLFLRCKGSGNSLWFLERLNCLEHGFSNVQTRHDYHRHTIYKSVQNQDFPETNGLVPWAETTSRVRPKTHQLEDDSTLFLMTYFYIEKDMATTCIGVFLATRGHRQTFHILDFSDAISGCYRMNLLHESIAQLEAGSEE